MNNKYDSVKLGALLGFIAPLLAFLSYYLINYKYMGWSKFFKYLALAKTSSSIVSLCVLTDLALFFIFIRKEKYLSSRGVLLATFVCAGVVCYLRFFTPSL